MTIHTYTLTPAGTESTTGYFSCIPEGLPEDIRASLAAMLDALRITPTDTFLHDFLLRRFLESDTATRNSLKKLSPSPYFDALSAEADLLEEKSSTRVHTEIQTAFPLLAWGNRHHRKEIAHLAKCIRDNITKHTSPRTLFVPDYLYATSSYKNISPADILNNFTPPPPMRRRPASETIAEALERLMDADFLSGTEYRHTSSLAPVGLFRRWPLHIGVNSGNLTYTLRGELTSWGRGFSVTEARVSCVMEMVERISSYISVNDGHILNRAHPAPLTLASYDELSKQNITALDPNRLPIGLPYTPSVRLWWMQAEFGNGEKILIPVQAAALFVNLDEPNLLLPPISTGLATGNTVAEARRAALLEVLERDAEAVNPWSEDREFTFVSSSPAINNLFKTYASRGVYPRFRELKTEFGIPCYECFVVGKNGACMRATGASLSAPQAVLAALTEVPWPFPDSPPTVPTPQGTDIRKWEDLPDYSTGSAEGDAALLDMLLTQGNHRPIYADLTRSDLQFPVVRAIVPGLELTADTDAWSIPSARYLGRLKEMR